MRDDFEDDGLDLRLRLDDLVGPIDVAVADSGARMFAAHMAVDGVAAPRAELAVGTLEGRVLLTDILQMLVELVVPVIGARAVRTGIDAVGVGARLEKFVGLDADARRQG